MKKILFLGSLLSATFAQAQVGFGTPNPDISAEVEIQSTDKGVLVPRITLETSTYKLKANVKNANSLLVYNIPQSTVGGVVKVSTLSEGFYYWKSKIENDVDNGSWIALGSEVSSMPKFFYMPSIILPTTPDMVTAMANSNITHDNGVYTVDLYALFKAQFDMPLKSSNAIDATTNSNVSSLSSFVFARAAYEYHVIYADANVFPHADISFLTGADNEGKLTYKVNANAIIRNGAFMNIVLKVKN